MTLIIGPLRRRNLRRAEIVLYKHGARKRSDIPSVFDTVKGEVQLESSKGIGEKLEADVNWAYDNLNKGQWNRVFRLVKDGSQE